MKTPFVYQGPAIGGQESYMSVWESQTKTVDQKVANGAAMLLPVMEVTNSMVSEPQPVVFEVPPVVKVEDQ
jgi:hypothetical protein